MDGLSNKISEDGKSITYSGVVKYTKNSGSSNKLSGNIINVTLAPIEGRSITNMTPSIGEVSIENKTWYMPVLYPGQEAYIDVTTSDISRSIATDRIVIKVDNSITLEDDSTFVGARTTIYESTLDTEGKLVHDINGRSVRYSGTIPYFSGLMEDLGIPDGNGVDIGITQPKDIQIGEGATITFSDGSDPHIITDIKEGTQYGFVWHPIITNTGVTLYASCDWKIEGHPIDLVTIEISSDAILAKPDK